MALSRNREVKNCLGIEKRSLVRIVRMVLWTSKRGTERWKLAEVEGMGFWWRFEGWLYAEIGL